MELFFCFVCHSSSLPLTCILFFVRPIYHSKSPAILIAFSHEPLHALNKLYRTTEQYRRTNQMAVEQRSRFYYRHPCLATEPIMFHFCLFIFFILIIHRSFSKTTRPIFAKYSGIVYSGVVWIIRQFQSAWFWHHLAKKNAKKQPKFAQNFTGWLKFLNMTSKVSKIIPIWNKLELGE